jgi:alcohol dehydrogenase/propanol-preferring alcohol dehydrogenase
MSKMRIVQVASAGGPLELVEREIPEPKRGEVRLRVEACGICHSDSFTKEGAFPGIEFPRAPGHEVAGRIDAVGEGVEGWSEGQRAAVGWHGGHCGHCDSCRRGDFVTCQISPLVPGICYDGGYPYYIIAPAGAPAAIPDGLSAVDAGPLMCAGITTFNALRHSGAQPGDLVAILGIGGLGHLGVQFAAKMGFETVAIARGEDKGPLAKELGAHHYIDSTAEDPAKALTALGGAKVVLATVTSGKAMAATIDGLGIDGKLVVLGAADAIEVSPLQLIMARRSIAGWPSGRSIDSEDTLAFSMLQGVRPMNEVYPLERADEAYARMMSGDARFRVVLTTEGGEA